MNTISSIRCSLPNEENIAECRRSSCGGLFLPRVRLHGTGADGNESDSAKCAGLVGIAAIRPDSKLTRDFSSSFPVAKIGIFSRFKVENGKNGATFKSCQKPGKQRTPGFHPVPVLRNSRAAGSPPQQSGESEHTGTFVIRKGRRNNAD